MVSLNRCTSLRFAQETKVQDGFKLCVRLGKIIFDRTDHDWYEPA